MGDEITGDGKPTHLGQGALFRQGTRAGSHIVGDGDSGGGRDGRCSVESGGRATYGTGGVSGTLRTSGKFGVRRQNACIEGRRPTGDYPTDQRRVMDDLRLQAEPLQLQTAYEKVRHDSAGAVATFSGTTRDAFQGKKVLSLRYEAYHEMAMSELRKLCGRARSAYSSVVGIAVHHRLGEVPVGCASVVIAASSPHRRDALGTWVR